MRLSLRGYQRGEGEGKQLPHCHKAAFRPSFLLACPAGLCQNTSKHVAEAPFMKLGRDGWRETQCGAKHRIKKVLVYFNSPAGMADEQTEEEPKGKTEAQET
jgi:hypothetical protein